MDHYLCYGEGEELEGKYLYTYDEDGKLLQVEVTDDSQAKTIATLYEYDEHGNLVSQEQYDREGNLWSKQETEYEKRTVKELFQKAFSSLR